MGGRRAAAGPGEGALGPEPQRGRAEPGPGGGRGAGSGRRLCCWRPGSLSAPAKGGEATSDRVWFREASPAVPGAERGRSVPAIGEAAGVWGRERERRTDGRGGGRGEGLGPPGGKGSRLTCFAGVRGDRKRGSGSHSPPFSP